MWIKKPNQILEDSYSQNVNFLFKQDKIYIMDNHLCAGWAWMNETDINSSHNLFHLDRHYDLSINEEMMSKYVIEKGVNLSKLNFDQYCELSFTPDYSDFELKLFQWDTYIGNINYIYPHFFNETIFSCHEDGEKIEGVITEEVSFEFLPDNISYWINRDPKGNWILNLDLDYFFLEIGDNTIQVFTDDYIEAIAKSIKLAMDNIQVLTICLSPECCGGWENALRVNKIICQILGIDFNLNSYSY